MREKAEQQMMSLLPNLPSLRVATYTVVSYDDTCAEGIAYLLSIFADPGSDTTLLEYAKDLAEDLNTGVFLDPERIPEP